MSGVLIIRYAVELASNDVESSASLAMIMIRTASLFSNSLSSLVETVVARRLPKTRTWPIVKPMKIGPNPGRSSVLVNFDAYFRGSGSFCGVGALLEPGDDRARPVPSGEVYGS